MKLMNPSQRFKQDIFHARKQFRKYGIPRQMSARKCKNKRENMAENIPGSLPVMGDAPEKDLVQWALAMQKQGLPVGREMIIQKASDIHY